MTAEREKTVDRACREVRALVETLEADGVPAFVTLVFPDSAGDLGGKGGLRVLSSSAGHAVYEVIR